VPESKFGGGGLLLSFLGMVVDMFLSSLSVVLVKSISIVLAVGRGGGSWLVLAGFELLSVFVG
jgi:hypothetical protein